MWAPPEWPYQHILFGGISTDYKCAHTLCHGHAFIWGNLNSV
jgi:hypothetical protein